VAAKMAAAAGAVNVGPASVIEPEPAPVPPAPEMDRT